MLTSNVPRRVALALAVPTAIFTAACASAGSGDSVPIGSSPARGDGGINLGNPELPRDGSVASDPPEDATTLPDLPESDAADARAPIVTTTNGIDTGMIPVGAYVQLSGLVLIGPVRSAGPDQSGACTYDAYVQDPAAEAPSGLRVFVDGDGCPGDGAACDCAPLGQITTKLDSLTQIGDVYDVVGFVSRYAFDAGPDEHGVYATTVTKTGSGAAPSPILVSDAGSDFGAGGSGFGAVEGMLVTIRLGAPAAMTGTDAVLSTYGGARFIRGYPIASSDGGVFPPSESRWSSITGIAWTAYGGAIAPRGAADFTP